MRRLEGVVVALWVAAGAGVAGLAGAALLAGGQRSLEAPAAEATPAGADAQAQATTPAPVYRSAVLSNDEWLSSLRSERAWSRRNSGSTSAPRSKLGGPSPKQAAPAAQPWSLFGGWGVDEEDEQLLPPPVQQSRTYRTVCVRLCDGYFFPISYSTTRDRFGVDEAACNSKCSSGARLFVYRNPGETPDDMVDVNGRPYAKLTTAFLYRTAYDASCKCTPHPWEQEARTRHRIYALEAERRKGNRKVIAELEDLRATTKAAAQGGKALGGKKGKAQQMAGKQPAIAPGRGGTTDLPAAPSVDVGQTSGGKLPAPALAELPAARPKGKSGTRFASDQSKAMRLGAGGAQPRSGGGSDWRRQILGPGPGL